MSNFIKLTDISYNLPIYVNINQINYMETIGHGHGEGKTLIDFGGGNWSKVEESLEQIMQLIKGVGE